MATPDDTTANLPVPATTRTYLRIRPTADPLEPSAVNAHVRRLHQLGASDTHGYLDRLRRTQQRPTIEVLLISRGGTDTTIDYWIGVDERASSTAVERMLRGLFPTSYEFELVEQPEGWLGSVLGDTHDASSVTGIEFHGRLKRSRDWQTRLTPFEAFLTNEQARIPLAAVAETMAESATRMVYQALLRPKPDWSRQAEDRRASIKSQQDTLGSQLVAGLFGAPTDREAALTAGDRERLAELDEKDPRRSFDCNARVVAISEDQEQSEHAIRDLTTAFGDVSQTCYEVLPRVRTGAAGVRVFEAIQDRVFRSPTPRIALRSTRPGFVVDASEAPSFVLLDGTALTAAGARALAPTPGERSTLPAPPAEQLTTYRGPGLPLGNPLTDDDAADPNPVVVPPALQPMHVAWFGKTGSGKSTAIVNAILANHAATDGADILIDPKGDGMAEDYLQAHYATYGDLENVLYFDCARLLPAFSFFNIRDELAAGVPRTTAVEDTVDHYIEILTQIMGRERFDQAVRSPDIIRYLVKAAFDPVNGQAAFSHRDLHSTVRRMHERQAAPAVSNDDLERMLGGVVANRPRSFDEIMQGVANRIEKIPIDQRLARIFNYVPDEDDPHFDLAAYLNEDVVIIFDTGELRTEAQRVLTLVILSNLWTALRRRSQRGNGSQPLVNLYVEEAASVAVSGLLKQLLSQSRSFDCSVTLAMQFPAQLKGDSQDVYEELLNNISTIVTGNVGIDHLLTQRLATDDMDATAVGNRLRALRRGQWLVSLPAGFDHPEPRPFLVTSLPLPPGDPAGAHPLSPSEETVFTAALEDVSERTRADAGLTLGTPTTATQREAESDDKRDGDTTPTLPSVTSALPYTKRLPPTVEYDGEIHALRCRRCDTRYDPSIEGMRRAISCCSRLEDVDPDDIPICDLNLKLTPEERAASEWSDHQLMFLQAVYNAQQLRYDPLAYDLLYDSMIRLQEYVGIDADAVQDLLDSELLRHDTDHPHRLYTVTPTGRKAIGESYRRGVDYGHGHGDLEESTQHVFAIEVARRYLEQEYVGDPESPVTDVVPYYDLDEGMLAETDADLDATDTTRIEQRRLDLVGLDATGEIIIGVEAERINNDVARAVPDDFDKLAACGVEEAIWVVMTRQAGHDVLAALNDPADGEPRIEKTYQPSTPPQQFRIDTPGLTAVYTVEYLRDRYLSRTWRRTP